MIREAESPLTAIPAFLRTFCKSISMSVSLPTSNYHQSLYDGKLVGLHLAANSHGYKNDCERSRARTNKVNFPGHISISPTSVISCSIPICIMSRPMVLYVSAPNFLL